MLQEFEETRISLAVIVMPQEVFQQRVKNVHSQWQFSIERDLKNYGNDAKYEFLHTQDTFFFNTSNDRRRESWEAYCAHIEEFDI